MGLASITNNILTDTGITPSGVISGTLGTGQVAYGSAANTIAGSNNLFWDNANGRLGVGTNVPSTTLFVSGIIGTSNRVRISAGRQFDLIGASTYLDLFDGSAGQSIIRFFATRNVGIGFTTDPAVRLGVSGDTLLLGSGNTSATTALTVQNSDSTSMLVVQNHGGVGIGSTSLTEYALRISKNITGAANSFGIRIDGAIQTDVTSSARGIEVTPSAASGTTLSQLYYFYARQNTFTGTVTNQSGFRVDNNLIGATNNYGFFGDISAAAGRWNLFMNGTASNYMAGALLIGITTNTSASVRVGASITGSTVSYGVRQDGTVQSDVTSAGYGYSNTLRTAAATFTLSNYYHFDAGAAAFGAGSAITNQVGFWAQNSLTGATNNYGFKGDIAAATGRWNLYMGGTADNYLAGSLGIGNTSFAGMNLRVSKSITGSATGRSVYLSGDFQSDVSIGYGVQTSFGTQAATFTLSDLIYFQAAQGTKGAGSTIGTQVGFDVASMTNGNTNIAFRGQNASAANVWNLYMNGTAANYLNGSLLIGSATDDGINKLQVTGSILATTNSTISGLSVGKGAGNVATNTAVGASALNANTTGFQNAAVGNEALRFNTTGVFNSAFGFGASRGNTTGYGNSSFGNNALRINTAGAYNNAFGASALYNNNGNNNTAVGHQALIDNTSGADNTAIGYGAGFAGSLLSNITGSNNIFIGANSVGESTSDSNRTFIGNTSTTSTWLGGNLLLGSRTDNGIHKLQVTGTANVTGNSSVGGNLTVTGTANVTGNSSVGGNLTVTGTTTSGTVTVNTNGQSRFISTRTGTDSNGNNIFIGDGGNSAVGSVGNTLLGSGNISLGSLNQTNLTTGYYNTSVGYASLSGVTTGYGNAALGQSSLGSITTGYRNAALGYNAGRYFGPTGTSINSTSISGIYIGTESRASAAGNTNEIVIGDNAVGNGSNTATLGNASTTATYLKGNVSANGSIRSDITQAAQTNAVSISLLGSNITTYAAGFSMGAAGYGLNAIYAQHEQRFGGNATFSSANLVGGGLILNKLAPTAAGTVTMDQIPTTGTVTNIRTMSNLHLMTQFSGNNNLTITHLSGLHIYGNYRTSGSGVITVSGAYYGVFLADPNEFGAGATVTGDNYGFYQQGTAPTNVFEGNVNIGTTATGGTSKLRISGLPTSAAGLLPGEVWSNGGVLTIVT